MHKHTTYATPASLLAPSTGGRAARTHKTPVSGTSPSIYSNAVRGAADSAYPRGADAQGNYGGISEGLPALTVKAWLAQASRYERPERQRVIAAAVGRAQARYANEGLFPVEWNGHNARVFVATPGTVEIALVDTRIGACSENEARFVYLPLARQEVLRFSLEYATAYESERKRNPAQHARGQLAVRNPSSDIVELRRDASENGSLEGRIAAVTLGGTPAWNSRKSVNPNAGRGCA